jgi:hypothetical protein
MADLIIVHELGSNEPILLNCAAILKGREHNDPAHGIYISLERSKGMSIIPRQSPVTLALYIHKFWPARRRNPHKKV